MKKNKFLVYSSQVSDYTQLMSMGDIAGVMKNGFADESLRRVEGMTDEDYINFLRDNIEFLPHYSLNHFDYKIPLFDYLKSGNEDALKISRVLIQFGIIDGKRSSEVLERIKHLNSVEMAYFDLNNYLNIIFKVKPIFAPSKDIRENVYMSYQNLIRNFIFNNYGTDLLLIEQPKVDEKIPFSFDSNIYYNPFTLHFQIYKPDVDDIFFEFIEKCKTEPYCKGNRHTAFGKNIYYSGLNSLSHLSKESYEAFAELFINDLSEKDRIKTINSMIKKRDENMENKENKEIENTTKSIKNDNSMIDKVKTMLSDIYTEEDKEYVVNEFVEVMLMSEIDAVKERIDNISRYKDTINESQNIDFITKINKIETLIKQIKQ